MINACRARIILCMEVPILAAIDCMTHRGCSERMAMCRLFGLSAGERRVRATFWLLEAPDSLAVQSRRDPHGTGLGIFSPDGVPKVDKRAVAAYEDEAFVREAREVESNVFIAHVRYATNGAVETKNTHPFEQHGRLMAHNGVIEDLPRLEERLGEYMSLVEGDTDSERFFALVTQEIDANDGDVGAGITSAVRWVASNLPLYSLNLVLITPNNLWALRYPDTNTLFVLDRKFDASRAQRHLDAASAAGTVRVRCGELATTPSVLVASERMDENPNWRSLEPGELLHVGPNLTVTSEMAISEPPAHQLGLEDLEPPAADSQRLVSAG